MTEKTCVIILNYRGGLSTLKCIGSVQATMDSKIYLIDNSEDALEQELIEREIYSDPGVELVFNKKNLGFAAGVNTGLRLAVGDGFSKFILLNNDTALTKDAGVILERAFSTYPGSLIAPAIQWGNDLCHGRFYHKYFGLIEDKSKVINYGWFFYLTGCALSFDKSVIEKIGFLNEKYFMYGEDVEFCFKAQKNNISLNLLDEILVQHEGSHSARMASLFYEYHINRAHFLLCFSLFDQPVKKIISFFEKPFFLAARAIIRSIRYRTISPIIGFLFAPLPLKIRPK